jgi:hypothetical protein
VQELADKKKEISSLDLESIVNEELRLEADADSKYELLHVQVVCGDSQVPTATITILDKTTNHETTTGTTRPLPSPQHPSPPHEPITQLFDV